MNTHDEVILRLEQRNHALEEEVRLLRATTVQLHTEHEAGEEYIALQLMRKLRMLQSEKVQLAADVEREEEFHQSSVLAMRQLRQQAIQLENAHEAEQESIVHRLSRQIQQSTREKSELCARLASLDAQLVVQLSAHTAATRFILTRLAAALGDTPALATATASTPSAEVVDLLATVGLSPSTPNSPTSLICAATAVLDRLDVQLCAAVDSHRAAATSSTQLISELEATRVENHALHLQLEEARSTAIAVMGGGIGIGIGISGGVGGPLSSTTLSSSSSTSSLHVHSQASASAPTTPRPSHIPHDQLAASPSTSASLVARALSSSSLSTSGSCCGARSTNSPSPLPTRSPRVHTPRATMPPALDALASLATGSGGVGGASASSLLTTYATASHSSLSTSERLSYPRDASQPRRGTMSGAHSPSSARSHSPLTVKPKAATLKH